MTFEDIKKANESIATTTITHKDRKTGRISSKEYAEVNQRIKAFRMVYPQGMIYTQMVSNEDGVCIFRAEVSADTQTILGVGHAYEKEGASFINETSYIENCETSAVGRALGMAGFGIDTSVASAEEVQNAMLNQKTEHKEVPLKDQKVSETNIQALIQIAEEVHADIRQVLNAYDLEKLEDMTLGTWTEVMGIFTRRKENGGKGHTTKDKAKSA